MYRQLRLLNLTYSAVKDVCIVATYGSMPMGNLEYRQLRSGSLGDFFTGVLLFMRVRILRTGIGNNIK